MSFPCYKAFKRHPMSRKKSPNSSAWHVKSSKMWPKFTLPALSPILHCLFKSNWISHSSPEMSKIFPWLCLKRLFSRRIPLCFLSRIALPHPMSSALSCLRPGASTFHLVWIFGFASSLLYSPTDFLNSAYPVLDSSLAPSPNTLPCTERAFSISILAENISETQTLLEGEKKV